MPDSVIPWLISSFGIVLSVMLGLVVSKLGAIEACTKQLDSKLFSHITASGLHEAGLTKLEGQIAALLQVSQALHARVDRMEQVR